MEKLLLIIVLLGVFYSCEKQPVEILPDENYLLGDWKQMDKYNLEWTFKPGGKFERFLIRHDGEIGQIMTGYYEQTNDSLCIIYRMQNNVILDPPPTSDFKIEFLEKENMIWSINDFEIRFRKL